MAEDCGRRVDSPGLSLNIKNPKTHQLASELARLTGESVTEAVTVAVRERLERLRSERDGSLADRMLAIGRDCASRLKEPYRSVDHAELLYDERGVPRDR
jgi:antitoxin VapB